MKLFFYADRSRTPDVGPKFEEQVEAIFYAKPAVFSFVFGIPPQSILEKCRSLGIKTVPVIAADGIADGGGLKQH